MEVIHGGNFPGGSYPGWEFSLVGVILGENFLWWESSGWELSGGNHLGGNFPGGSFHVTNVYKVVAEKHGVRNRESVTRMNI